MSTATTTTTAAATITTMSHHRHAETHSPRTWAVTLAVLALLGLAMLTFLGVELGTQVHAAAETVQGRAVEALAGLEGTLAGIRWVR